MVFSFSFGFNFGSGLGIGICVGIGNVICILFGFDFILSFILFRNYIKSCLLKILNFVTKLLVDVIGVNVEYEYWYVGLLP